MFHQQVLLGRLTASRFSRGPPLKQRTPKDGMRYYARRTITINLAAAATRAAAAAAVAALASLGIYEVLTSPSAVQEHTVVCKLFRTEFCLTHLHCRAIARQQSLTTANTVAVRATGLTSLLLSRFNSPTVERRRNCTTTVDILGSTWDSCSTGCKRTNSRRRPTRSDSSEARKTSSSNSASRSSITSKTSSHHNTNNTCRPSNGAVSVRVLRISSWYGVIPSVVGAAAQRPLHLAETTPAKEKEHADSSEVIDTLARSHRQRRSFSSGGTRTRKGRSFNRAMLRHPVTFASLGAAVFAAGVLAGAGLMAMHASERRKRGITKAADAFVKSMTGGARARTVKRDAAAEGHDAYTRQMWSAVRLLAGTVINNALQTLLFTMKLSPLLFLVADAGFKAGVQAWARGNTVATVLQHTLLAGGYASAVGVLGNWQLLLLPLSVLVLYAAAGKGLKTKDSVTSGAIFAESMPVIEARLKAEKNPKNRAVLAGKLLESVAREYKHKHLLDEGLRGALSQTLTQLKRDLLKGLPPAESCRRAHKKFNKLLSLKFVSPATPAGAGARVPPTNAGAAAPSPHPPQGAYDAAPK